MQKKISFQISQILKQDFALYYTGAFYFLSRSLQFIDLNIAYATWAGIGVVAAAIISMLVFHESINAIGAVGMALVVSGVVLLNLYGPSH